MTYFAWGSYLNTGHEMIDNDHRQLVGMINALYDAIEKKQGQGVMGKVLDNLLLYCKVHFQREEDEMQRIHYPKYLAHKKEHELFTHDVKKLKQSYDGGVPPNPVHVGKMLSDWLRNHIVVVDMDLAGALKATK